MNTNAVSSERSDETLWGVIGALGLWFLLYVVGSLLPLWGTWIGDRLFKHQVELMAYMSQGEFFLYSAALACASLYVLICGRKPYIRFRGWLSVLNIIVLVVSTLVFAYITMANRQEGTPRSEAMDSSMLFGLSAGVYSVALVLALFGAYGELRAVPVPADMEREQLDSLTNRFRNRKES